MFPKCRDCDALMRSDKIGTSINLVLIFVFVYIVKQFLLKLTEESVYS